MNADGTLDTTFGNGTGVNTLPVYAMALQPDGRVLIGGGFTSVDGTTCNSVARLNADGSFDSTFNTAAGANGNVLAMALQPDGKLVVGGNFTTFAGVARKYLAKLNPDGSLDTGFVGPSFAGSGFQVNALALQPDNKTIVGGEFYFSGGPFSGTRFRSGIVRTGTNGTVDTTFDPGDGAHVAGSTSSLESVTTVAVQPNGFVLAGGYFTGFNSVAHNYIVRLTGTGSLDAAFNPSADSWVNALLVQADGKILVGGNFAHLNGVSSSCFGRLLATGSTDASFNVGAGSTSEVWNFALQADGKAVLGAGYGSIQGVSSVAVGRFFEGLPGLPGTVQLSATSYAGAEGTSLAITATRTSGTYGAVSVNYATIPGSAVAARYSPVVGTLSWASGDSAAKSLSIPLINDHVVEPDQTLSLSLGIPIGGLPLANPWISPVALTEGPVTSGQSVTLPANATGTAPFTYKWMKNGAAITGATNSTFTIPSVSSGDAAVYSVLVTDAASKTSTSSFTLTVVTLVSAMPPWARVLLLLLLLFVAARCVSWRGSPAAPPR